MLRLWFRAVLVVLVTAMTVDAQTVTRLTSFPWAGMGGSDFVGLKGKLFFPYGPDFWSYDTLTGTTVPLVMSSFPGPISAKWLEHGSGDRLYFRCQRNEAQKGFQSEQSIWYYDLNTSSWGQVTPWPSENQFNTFTQVFFLGDKLFIAQMLHTIGPSAPWRKQIIWVDLASTAREIIYDDGSQYPGFPAIERTLDGWAILVLPLYNGTVEDAVILVDPQTRAQTVLIKMDPSTSCDPPRAPGWFNRLSFDARLVDVRDGIAVFPWFHGETLDMALWARNLSTGALTRLTPEASGIMGNRGQRWGDYIYLNEARENDTFSIARVNLNTRAFERLKPMPKTGEFNPMVREFRIVRDRLLFLAQSTVPTNQLPARGFDITSNHAASEAMFTSSVPINGPASSLWYTDNDYVVMLSGETGHYELFGLHIPSQSVSQLTDFRMGNFRYDSTAWYSPIFRYGGKRYFAANYTLNGRFTRQLFSLDLPSGTTSNEVDRAEADGPRWSVYPNPADATSRVRFTLEQPAEVSASLYTADGRELVIAGSRRFDAGAHELPLPTFSGIGVVRVSIGGRASSQKVLR